MSARTATASLLPDLMLLTVAAVWGSSYGVVKDALAVYPVLGLLALRFGLTSALLLPALRHLRHCDGRTVAGMLGTGVLLLAIFLCETFGVMQTQASHAAFLISLCVVLTPFAEWLLLGRMPARREWAAVALSLLGAALLTGGSLRLQAGDVLMLAAALLRAVIVCVTKRMMRERAGRPVPPALLLTAVQSGVVALGSAAVLLGVPAQWQALPAPSLHAGFWASVVYLVGACTLFAFFAQNYAIRRSQPTRVALLMGSEPAFGALFACLWLGERIAPAGWAGGALIVGASLLATVRWRRLPRAGLALES
ncbi:multidrug DMT transporter permease [Cupriavidus sp. USMAA2-4]|uniref:DMT family transporter n=1 Tax=unclassified Cupriavidus TaxID=2640874 RepID=UPI0008A7016C|nr:MULTISPECIES: DMT family transporter [unclassified Cupriavidus]AOY96816.1 multidrug DMT transporter permease [Cupriavidus sp. USMAA2-4]AOZ02778.1 multidrug DMT transporter permease [Cupriavidus sp. USMAHM13]